VLEKEGHYVKILDCTAEQISVDIVEEKLKEYETLDFVGFTATTPLFPNALKIAKICKRLFPDVKIIFGGVHPSVMPDEVLSYDFVDYVVIDEGEETTKELLDGKDPSEIRGLCYKKDKKIVHNESRHLIKDLDSIPIPAYHLLPMDKYKPALGNYKRLPAMSIFATRGCPGRCTFCHRAFRGIVRKRSAQDIIKEIKVLQKKYGIKEISFYDDTFTLFKDVVNAFCDIILREKIDITWSCFTRVDYVSRELLEKMKKAGCHLILFGVESADEEILKNINKRISLEQVKKVVKIARNVGIDTRASFMFGNPGETEETIKKTIRFAKDLDPDEVQFNITTVYPGTDMYEWAQKNGYIVDRDWSKYHMSNIVMELPTVSSKVIRKYYKTAHRKFYMRPKIIFRRLLKIRSFTQLIQEVRGALVAVRS
jgi:radical SAM superfamily enzyme YgiQ (UPF0313 family)